MRVGPIAFAALLLLGAGAAFAQDREPLSQEAFDRLVEKLGYEDFETREAAHRELESYGREILPRLKEAHEKAKDLERRTRLDEIIRKIESPPMAKPAERNRLPEQEFGGGGVFRIERGDPKKALEEMNKLIEQMKRVLENKDLSDEEKLREMTRLSAQLQSAALRGTSGNVIRIQRVVRGGQQPPQEPGGGSGKIPTEDPRPAPVPEKQSKPKEY